MQISMCLIRSLGDCGCYLYQAVPGDGTDAALDGPISQTHPVMAQATVQNRSRPAYTLPVQ